MTTEISTIIILLYFIVDHHIFVVYTYFFHTSFIHTLFLISAVFDDLRLIRGEGLITE